MIKLILLCQLLFFMAFGISYGELKRQSFEKGKIQGLTDAVSDMSLEQLQNIKITES